MRHSFRLKKPQLKSIFLEKLGIKSISVENGEDVKNAIDTLLIYSELEDFLTPVECTYNFINVTASFQLELKPNKEKKEFFEAIRNFETFIETQTA